MTSAHARYLAYLERLPAPGGGGAHRAIYAAGCLGVKAGLGQEQVGADIRAHLPPGGRIVSDREIEEGVAAGFAAVTSGKPASQRPAPAVEPGAFARLVAQGRGMTEADIAARSPISVDVPTHETAALVLQQLYEEEELVFIGDDRTIGRMGNSIRPAGEWADLMRRSGAVAWPKVIPNPLSGRAAPKKSGSGESLRGDACVAAHRFAVVEMDSCPLTDQLAFWAAVKMPVACLIHSGGKSVHGWVRVDCRDGAEWQAEVERKLFPSYLEPMGFDSACKNAARLSRMPGHCRKDKGQIQRLLYLAPQGKAVFA